MSKEKLEPKGSSKGLSAQLSAEEWFKGREGWPQRGAEFKRLCAGAEAYAQYKTEQLQREKEEWRLEYLTEKFNRSKRQTLELLELLGGDWDKLERLEVAIRKQFIAGCPETLEEVEAILTPNPEK